MDTGSVHIKHGIFWHSNEHEVSYVQVEQFIHLCPTEHTINSPVPVVGSYWRCRVRVRIWTTFSPTQTVWCDVVCQTALSVPVLWWCCVFSLCPVWFPSFVSRYLHPSSPSFWTRSPGPVTGYLCEHFPCLGFCGHSVLCLVRFLLTKSSSSLPAPPSKRCENCLV